MKDKIDEITELLSQIEGVNFDPEHEQRMRNLRLRWDHADTAFHAAFYHLKKLSPDDATTVSPATLELQEAFKMVEECCKEWQEELSRVLPNW